MDPVLGDVTNPRTMNGYNYGNNNPVMYIDPEGTLAWAVVGALSSAFVAWATYQIEVKLKIRKYTKKSLIAKVSVAAGLGAISGGISGFAKFGGLLNSALKAGVLTSKEVKLYKKFLTGKNFVYNMGVNFATKKSGSETWFSYVQTQMRRVGIVL